MYSRMVVAILGQNFRHGPVFCSGGQTDGKPFQLPFVILQGHPQVLIQDHHPTGIFEHDLPLFRGFELPFAAEKQPYPQLFFQLLHVLADGRLGEG